MKRHNWPSILCAILLFGAVLVSPAFADMKKVDEAELARMNASLIGASNKDRSDGALPADGTFDKTVWVVSPSDSKTSENFRLTGPDPEPWTYNYGAVNPNYFGSITGVKSR
jgi:hypothetical protein